MIKIPQVSNKFPKGGKSFPAGVGGLRNFIELNRRPIEFIGALYEFIEERTFSLYAKFNTSAGKII